MDPSLPFFTLPFVDSVAVGLDHKPEPVYDVLNTNLPPHSALLGAEDVLAQFLSGDEPLEEPDLNGPTTLHCEICGKQFDNAKKYYGHLRVHSKDNLWTCEKCPNLKFSTKQQLMKHSLTHKPLELIWKCPHCSMGFEALWKLQQHLFHKHLNYRPRKCDVCEKTFYKPSDLKKHKDTHNETKKYACTVCEARFNDKSNMKRHMLKHTKEKPYCCSGCRNRFQQLTSLKRHIQRCPLNRFASEPLDKSIRRHHCRICGLHFQYKSALVEHCNRQHSNNPTESNKDDKYQNSDANRIVDNIVDDILSAEDDYMTMSTQNPIMNICNQPNIDNNADNLMQIELLKDMNQFHMLDELYNDIDFDSIQPSHIFNTNYVDYGHDRNDEIFNFTDGKSLDQDIMNAICHKNDLPDDLLNPDVLARKVECATIFESDVDLEASSNLAANLSQLIGDNHVQYISSEYDDTFIISLNSEIDAEKLTDMLNIGVELVNNKNEQNDVAVDEIKTSKTTEPLVVKIEDVVQPVIVKLDESVKLNIETIKKNIQEAENALIIKETENNNNSKENKTSVKKMIKLFVCRTCNKVFNKRNVYKSHRALHDASLRSHVCGVCGERFGYRSSLTKHERARHTPHVARSHKCQLCDATFTAAWLLKTHVSRDHERAAPYVCSVPQCGKRVYKRSDLVVHNRYHTGERPYSCVTCARTFSHVSHLRRHHKRSACAASATKVSTSQKSTTPEI